VLLCVVCLYYTVSVGVVKPVEQKKKIFSKNKIVPKIDWRAVCYVANAMPSAAIGKILVRHYPPNSGMTKWQAGHPPANLAVNSNSQKKKINKSPC
jgi:hypothetical protein